MFAWTRIPMPSTRDAPGLFDGWPDLGRGARPAARRAGLSDTKPPENRLAKYFDAPAMPEPAWRGQWRTLKHL